MKVFLTTALASVATTYAGEVWADPFRSLQTISICESRSTNIDSIGCLARDGSVEFASCCDLDLEFEPELEEHKCIVKGETNSSYCSGTCDQLTKLDTFEMSMSFNKSTNEPICVEKCTCYGDPECVSFDEVWKAWIVCDGRKGDLVGKDKNHPGYSGYCPQFEEQCDTQDTGVIGEDGQMIKCVWEHDKPSTQGGEGKGWSIATMGSPCRPPQSLIDAEGLKMTMHKTPDFDLTLYLGERGIISSIEFYVAELANDREETFKLNATACFADEDPFERIVGANALEKPVRIEENKLNPKFNSTDRLFIVTIPSSQTRIEIGCVRGGDGKNYKQGSDGNPHINIGELMVPSDQKDQSGFCRESIIPGAPEEGEASREIHETCTANHTTVPNGCRALVSHGFSNLRLGECATEFCNMMKTSTLRQECLDEVVKPSEKYALPNTSRNSKKKANNLWVKYVCKNQDKDTFNTCDGKVKQEGFAWAVDYYNHREQLSEDVPRISVVPSCSADISDYDINKPRHPCAEGVYIEFETSPGSDIWEDKYFVPSTGKECNFVMDKFSNLEFFNQRFRFRNCDPRGKPECKARLAGQLRTGAKIEYSYESGALKLQKAFETGELMCSPDAPNCILSR